MFDEDAGNDLRELLSAAKKYATRHEVDAGRILEVIYSRQGFKDKKGFVVVTAYWLE